MKELCGDTKSNLSKTDKLMGYLHYEAGLSLMQISNDLTLHERYVKRLNENLLKTLGVKETPWRDSNPRLSNLEVPTLPTELQRLET